MVALLVEDVVLVDEGNRVLGTAPKDSVHGSETPLHRGFSLFLFDGKGRLLLQQRSRTKETWPLAWSNSVCGHPALHESNVDAARRRLAIELTMEAVHIEEVATYRYTFVRNGVMENEICPILVGITNDEPKPNPEEVAATRWVPWTDFIDEIKGQSGNYTEWCEEEASILVAIPRLDELLILHTS